MSKALFPPFLDLNDRPDQVVAANMLRLSCRHEGEDKRKGRGPSRKAARGQDLAMISKSLARNPSVVRVCMRQLGGKSIMMTGAEMNYGRGETIADTARVLCASVDAIMIPH